MRVRSLPFLPSVLKTAKGSRVALATNQETAGLLRRMGALDVRLWLDSGIPREFISNARAPKADSGALQLLWVGRMVPRKALPLALEALAEAREVNLKLLIVGDGQMRKAWEDCAKALHLENRTHFLGTLPWNQMFSVYRSADVFLFTSLRDSFGMQVLEAMGHGLPILTLDHQGTGTFVPSDAGIKVSVTNPHDTVNGIATAIRCLASNPETRRKLGERGRAFAETQTWERHAERMSGLYDEVLSTWPAFRRN